MAHLFIYGTLRKKTVIRAITGKTFPRNRAVLHDYKIFEQRSGFPYILNVKGNKVNGYILRDLDDTSLEKIDRYENEGTIYSRIAVQVETANGAADAYTYVGSIANIRRTFGDHIDETINTRVEQYLESQIDEHIPLSRRSADYDNIEFVSKKEFFDCEIQHLLNLYFSNMYVSPNRISEDLNIKKIPTLAEIKNDTSIAPYAEQYLDLACRFMVFNRTADIIHHFNRTALFVKEPFSIYSPTNLVTLRLLNSHKKEFNYLLSIHCPPSAFAEYEYTDYAKGAAQTSLSIYRSYKTEIEYIIREISMNKQEGRVPLGAEMEFSNIGNHAVFNCRPYDRVFNNFRYFNSFDLLRRCWRLGGHIDDHVLSTQNLKNDGGFLEFALGKNPLLQYTSKPVSNDIYVLSSLIEEVTDFIPAEPHSLHISLENVMGEIDWSRSNDVDLIKCLFLLGGDFRLSFENRIFEKRLTCREITDPWGNTEIITENRQFPNSPQIEEECRPTIEFQFPRLKRNTAYMPLIMGIKGFYLGYNPRPYSSKLHIVDAAHIHDESEEIRTWAHSVTSLSKDTVNEFLSSVEKGLFTGLHEKTLKHRKRFLQEEMFLVEKAVKSANDWIRRNSETAHSHS